MTLIVLSISSVMPLVFGGQSVSVSSQINQEALYKAHGLLENARALSRADFAAVTSSPTTTESIYQLQTVVDPTYTTQCSKNVIGHVGWTNGGLPLNASLSTRIGSIAKAVALGGNCDVSSPTGDWKNPAIYNCSGAANEDINGMDVLNRIVYMVGDAPPYLFIYDTNDAPLNQSCQQSGNLQSVGFNNGFEDDRTLYDIRVARFPNDKMYAFVARGVSADPLEMPFQFEVIDVTDIHNPVSVAKRSLSGVSGSAPGGWRLYYYDQKIFMVTKFTAGPEFHIFDVSNPADPREIGSGTNLGRTVESLLVVKKNFEGITHYIAYMATDKNTAPLSIYDMVFPTPTSVVVTERTADEPLFNQYQDGQSVFLLDNTLYFGRASDPAGKEVFAYDVSNPLSGFPIPLLGQANVSQASIKGIWVSGSLMFLATTKSGKEFQVFKSDPADMSLVNYFNFPNIIYNGLKYEDQWLYLASKNSSSLGILYNP